ncbi:MAG: anti-sigma regulatory factor [Phycisphaeraceae bacterium]|nr:anti-sigma regulatory factor [Phycisphaeraceae bacterium]
MKKLTIRSRTSEVQKVHDQLTPLIRSNGYSEDAQFAIRLAVDEAIANAIWHGNDSDPDKHIVVEYEVDEEAVRVSVRDDGPGFDPGTVPDPTLDENLQRPHGRGIMLMQAYMSEVRFNKEGNCVTLVKERKCERPRRSAS